MSYSLHYGTSRYDRHRKTGRRKTALLFFAALLSAIILLTLFSGRLSQFRRHILPFLEPNVREAFSDMAERIDAGSGPGEAAAAFCREVISEAIH